VRLQRGSFGIKAKVEADYYPMLFGDEYVVFDEFGDAWELQ